jgi:hypothetical protein
MNKREMIKATQVLNGLGYEVRPERLWRDRHWYHGLIIVNGCWGNVDYMCGSLEHVRDFLKYEDKFYVPAKNPMEVKCFNCDTPDCESCTREVFEPII